ncbi:hypothetical protein BGZ70_007837 [Mortierella alpina]|uniref:ATP-grasp domain-containing protein n=1 Tax=Mortierella alpina TaxID=64518 RepID=A0A9P6M622_MORAP|nr:hypothetical protein BGZ70_007837 [Mortierella alpina]
MPRFRMKICVFLSSYEGVESEFKDMDATQNPSRYVKSHDFHLRYIKKDTAEQQIDQACQEGFDLYYNLLWGQRSDNVAGIDAVQYLESKGLPFIGTSSKFLSLSKADFKKAASGFVQVPGETQFPLIIKPSRGCASLYMTEKSVCHNQDQLSEQIALLRTKTSDDIIVEEFIVGKEFTVVVVEVDDDIIALAPYVCEFPTDMEPMQQFIHFQHKMESLRHGVIQFKRYDGELLEELQDTACKAYRALDVFGSGYARVDIRVAADNSIYVLEVNPMPCLFYADIGDLSDDDIISQCFPRGHEGLMDNLIATKLRSHVEKKVQKNYDVMSVFYDDRAYSEATFPHVIRKIVAQFPFQGTVLDLGSGTGIFGSLIQASYDATLTGIDLSPMMAAKATHYKKLYIGTIQRMLPFVGCFDHVVSSGALYFLDKDSLLRVMDRCFIIAQQSITFGIEDIPDAYNNHLAEMGKGEMYSHNHTSIVDSYVVPEGWHLVYKEKHFLWFSPATGDNVHGTFFRFERLCEI